MSKILLVGPAGSGKTHRLLDDFEQALKHSQNPLAADFFFVLPSAEHTERIISVIVQRGVKGFFNRRITTLSRLIETVFGLGDREVASSVTRFLLLRDLFEKNIFEYFKEIQQSSGFIQLVLSFIDELKETLISPGQFRERMNALKQLEPDLSLKYEALARIYELYSEELTRQGLRDRQDSLTLYRELKKQGKIYLPRFKKIWIDGFFDFSNLQLEYLRDLTELADSVLVTLTKDNTPLRRDLFERIQRTEEFLLSLGFKPELMKGPNRRAEAKALAEVEHLLFSLNEPKKLKGGEEIRIFEAVGMEGEIEMIAREIEISFRRGGYRYSDFAILLRKIGSYADVIRSVFDRYQIPVEIHEREKLQFAPFIQVIVSFFKIFREGWKRNDLIHFLKSSYVQKWGETSATPNGGSAAYFGGKKQEEWIHQLEHWALFHGIVGGREDWLNRRDHSGQISIEEDFYIQKEKVLKRLADFEDHLREAKDFPELKRRILNGLHKHFGFFETAGGIEPFVRRDAVSYKRFEALMDEIGVFFATHPHAAVDLDAMIDRFLHLVELDLYSLHDRDKNRVQVYDVSLARQKEYRVVFVAGLLEKSFPVQVKEDPILSDWERELFNGGKGASLSLRLERQNLERYLFYLAVTRARERLYLSYPRLDLEGQESLPSYYVDEVNTLFEEPLKIKQQVLSRPYPDIHDVLDERELQIALVGELWDPLQEKTEDEPLLLSLTNELLSDEKHAANIRRAFYEIKPELADPLIREGGFFRSLKTSPTKLEEYAKCPYRYFANRVLHLKDPEEEVNVKLKGIILHQVLENFFIHWKDHFEDMTDPSKAKGRLKKELEKALNEHPLIFEKKYQLELDREELWAYLERFILDEMERLKSASLKPRYFELSFGLPEPGAYPVFELEDQDRKISISGKMDRVDVDPKHHYGLVIDYKRSAQFKKEDLELGIALQLPIYLSVIEKYLKLKPIGGELYSIKDREKKGFYHEEGTALFNHASKRKSYLSEEAFQAILSRGLRFVKRFTQEMGEAQIPVKPRFCDPFCPYSSVCRIEKWRLPLILEEIKEEDKKNATH